MTNTAISSKQVQCLATVTILDGSTVTVITGVTLTWVTTVMDNIGSVKVISDNNATPGDNYSMANMTLAKCGVELSSQEWEIVSQYRYLS